MTTATHPIAAAEAAAEILKLIRHRLPDDAQWVVSEAGDGFYHMTVYANVEGTLALQQLAAPVMVEMLRKGVPFALVFDSPERLAALPEDLDVRDIHWRLES